MPTSDEDITALLDEMVVVTNMFTEAQKQINHAREIGVNEKILETYQRELDEKVESFAKQQLRLLNAITI